MKNKLEIENKIKQLKEELGQNKPSDTPMQKQFVLMIENSLTEKINLLRWVLGE